MAKQKCPRLARGLHWGPKSPYILFNWRDALGKQHHQSTGTTNPQEALLFKLKFLANREEKLEEAEADGAEDLGRLPLSKVSEMYFGWKTAKSSAATVERERRIFKPLLKWLGAAKIVKTIKLVHLRQYQQQRRKHVSHVMKQPVTARTVNYELDLLRGVLKYAGCWTPELETEYQPLPELKSQVGRAATVQQLAKIIKTAKTNESWGVALYAASVAIGSGCRGCEIRTLQLRDIHLKAKHIVIRRESAKNRTERHPRLTAVAEWGLRNLLKRASALGSTQPEHYLLPLNIRKSRILSKATDQKWDVTRPMATWVKSWRRLMQACGMPGFRFHDLRHSFRTLGAQAGVPLEVMMAQVGHMDRETSLEYVHIQQNALERAQRLIEREQTEVLRATRSKVPASKNGDAHARLASKPGGRLHASGRFIEVLIIPGREMLEVFFWWNLRRSIFGEQPPDQESLNSSLCHNSVMNWDQMKKNVHARVQLKPTPQGLDDLGRKRPPIADDWIIEAVSADGVRIRNVRTDHTTTLGKDHIYDFSSNPDQSQGGTKHGFLT